MLFLGEDAVARVKSVSVKGDDGKMEEDVKTGWDALVLGSDTLDKSVRLLL